MAEPLKVLYLDCETTGFDPVNQDIIQLALISEVDGKVVEEAEFFMQPLRFDNMSPDALLANGMTEDQIARFPTQVEVFPQILAFLDRQVDKHNPNDKMYAVGYNVRFDLQFIAELFKKNNNTFLGAYVRWQDIDLLYLMYVHDFLGSHKLRSYKLGAVSKAYGIKHLRHDALSDSRVVRELTHRFLMPFRKPQG